MSKSIITDHFEENWLDQLCTDLQQTIIMNADGEPVPFRNFYITEIFTDEIHFSFGILGKDFICHISWQTYLANQVKVNQLKIN
jgi:hypothetical protein